MRDEKIYEVSKDDFTMPSKELGMELILIHENKVPGIMPEDKIMLKGSRFPIRVTGILPKENGMLLIAMGSRMNWNIPPKPAIVINDINSWRE